MREDAKLAHLGHALTENRHGLALAVSVSEANGRAECAAALAMLDRLKSRHELSPKRLGADKGFDSGPFFLELEQREIEPQRAVTNRPAHRKEHVAFRRPAVAARERMKARLTTLSYQLSQ